MLVKLFLYEPNDGRRIIDNQDMMMMTESHWIPLKVRAYRLYNGTLNLPRWVVGSFVARWSRESVPGLSKTHLVSVD